MTYTSPYKISLTRTASKKFKKLDGREKVIIYEAFQLIKDHPHYHPNHIRKLVGNLGYRYKKGRWRVVYGINEESKTIIIRSIGLRKEDTYR